jgi:4-alpha-glucanotransferase
MEGAPNAEGPTRRPVVVDVLVQYWTVFGQQVGVVGSVASLGGGSPAGAPLLHYEDGALWRGRFTVAEPCVLRYRYFLATDGGGVELEWGPDRELDLTAADAPAHVELRETWRAPGVLSGFFHPTMARYAFGRSLAAAAPRAPPRAPVGPSDDAAAGAPSPTSSPSRRLLDSALAAHRQQQLLQGRRGGSSGGGDVPATAAPAPPPTLMVRVRFQLHEPRVPAGAQVAVCGSVPALGGWDPRAAPAMDGAAYPLWSLELLLPASALPAEYKFVLVVPAGSQQLRHQLPSSSAAVDAASLSATVEWEDGGNRYLAAPEYALLGSLLPAERAALSRQLLAERARQPDALAVAAHAAVTAWAETAGGAVPPAGPAAPTTASVASAGALLPPAIATAAALRSPPADPLADYSADTWVRRPAVPPPAAAVPVVSDDGPARLVAQPAALLAQETTIAAAVVKSDGGKPAAPQPTQPQPPLPPPSLLSPTSATGRVGGDLGDASVCTPTAAGQPAQQMAAAARSLASPGWASSVGAAPPVPAADVDGGGTFDDELDHGGAVAAATAGPAVLTPGRPGSTHGASTATSGGSGASSLLVAHSFMMRREGAAAWRAASLCIPLFSLRSERGLGVGEFGDLPALVAWAASVGLKMVHLAPVNDTTATGSAEDSSPHRVTSAFALHPQYISFDALLLRPPAGCDDGDASAAAGGTSPSLDAYAGPFSLGLDADGVPIAARVPAHFVARLEAARLQLNGGSSGSAGGGMRQVSSSGSFAPAALQPPSPSTPGIAALLSPGGASGGYGGGGGGGGGGGNSSWAFSPFGAAHQQHQQQQQPHAQLYGRVLPSDVHRFAPREPLDYEAVMRQKMALLRDLFRSPVGDAVLGSPGFSGWFRANREWLQPYALFCFFRDLHGTADPARWGSRATVTQAQLHSLTDASQFHYRSIAFWYFTQYLLHVQLAAAAALAAAAGVLLQVDVPLGLSRASVDVWATPHLFRVDRVVGAPPDAASPVGRRSECVPYDWDAVLPTAAAAAAAAGGALPAVALSSPIAGGASAPAAAPASCWWGRRLRQLGAYFPSVRLTHVDEYFRTYELPATAVTGLGGVFAPPGAGFAPEELDAAGLAPLAELLPRLTQPYVREWTARAALGPDYAHLVPLFFDIAPATGAYTFKPGLATEAALRAAFDSPPVLAALRSQPAAAGKDGGGGGEPDSREGAQLQGLLQLLQNVCLIEALEPSRSSSNNSSGGGARPALRLRYHPRTDLHKTTSFLELPEPARQVVSRLHALYFTARAPDTWRAVGRARVAALQALAPDVLLFSDDPLPRAGITDVLLSLGVLGVRSHRLGDGAASDGSGAGGGGGGAPMFDYGCVAVPSSPDMAPLRSWWEEDASLSARFYYAVLVAQAAGGGGAQAVASLLRLPAQAAAAGDAAPPPPPPVCTPEVAVRLLALYAGGPPAWAEFLLQDLLAMDAGLRGRDAHGERINVPSVPRHVWRWRMGVTLEELAGEPGAGFRRQVATLLGATGRARRAAS